MECNKRLLMQNNRFVRNLLLVLLLSRQMLRLRR